MRDQLQRVVEVMAHARIGADVFAWVGLAIVGVGGRRAASNNAAARRLRQGEEAASVAGTADRPQRAGIVACTLLHGVEVQLHDLRDVATEQQAAIALAELFQRRFV